MSIREMSWALNQESVTTMQKFVLLAIADNADGDGKSLCSQASISQYTNIAEADVSGIVAELAGLGLLLRYPDSMYMLECGPSQFQGYFSPPKKRISSALRLRVFHRDGMACLRCGSDDIGKLRADHVVPESKGGPATLENLQTLCEPCNSWKGVKSIDFRKEVAL